MRLGILCLDRKSLNSQMYCWVPPPGPDSAERTQGSGRIFPQHKGWVPTLRWGCSFVAMTYQHSCRGGQVSPGVADPFIPIPSPSPAGDSGAIWGLPTTRIHRPGWGGETWAGTCSGSVSDSWAQLDKPGGISSPRMERQIKKPSFRIYRHLLGGQGFLHSTETLPAIARLPGWKHITRLEGKTHWC